MCPSSTWTMTMFMISCLITEIDKMTNRIQMDQLDRQRSNALRFAMFGKKNEHNLIYHSNQLDCDEHLYLRAFIIKKIIEILILNKSIESLNNT